MFSSKFTSLGSYFLKYSFCPFLFLFPFVMHILAHLMVSHRFVKHRSFFLILLFFPFIKWDHLNCLSSSQLILSLAAQICCEVYPVHFHYTPCISPLQKFYLSLFYHFYLFNEILYLVKHHAHIFLQFFRYVSFSSLNIIKIENLRSLFTKSNVWTSSETISIEWVIVLCFFTSLITFLNKKLDILRNMM